MDREWRIEDRRRLGLVVAHRLETAERGAGRVDGDVGAGQAVPPEDFVEHERPAGVGDIGHQCSAAQVGDARDLRLDEQVIEAVVAAGHDDGVHLRRLDQRHALIGSAVHDRVAAIGQALALLLGVRRGDQSDGKAAPCEKSARLRGEQRKRLRAGKSHDGELGLIGGHGRRSRLSVR